MTNPNVYLRLADVETMLEGRITALEADAERHGHTLQTKRLSAGEHRAALGAEHRARTRASATRQALDDLQTCPQFLYRRFGDAGEERTALVDATADRMPLKPVEI